MEAARKEIKDHCLGSLSQYETPTTVLLESRRHVLYLFGKVLRRRATTAQLFASDEGQGGHDPQSSTIAPRISILIGEVPYL